MYRIEAEAEAGDQGVIKVAVPLAVEHGKTTVVHLEGDWTPPGNYSDAEVVRLPGGQIAGWRALELPPAQPQTRNPG